MADKKISELTSATSVNTTDFFPIVQAGSTVKLDFATFLAHVPVNPIVVQVTEAPASGALSTTLLTSLVTSASGATNYTLAASTHGTTKVIAASTMGGSATAIVTVTGAAGFTTITFSAVGQIVTLQNINGSWFAKSVRGAVVA